MKGVVDFGKSLLVGDIRTKNATSFLAALLSVVTFYFASKRCQWFEELHQEHGACGVAVAMMIVFLAVFLGVWLVYSGIATHYGRVVARQQAQQKVEKQQRTIRDNLESLTEWQRGFLLRFVVENRRQIPAFEVGTYRAAWDPEMDVLITKGIVGRYPGEVYEVNPQYYAYLMEHDERAKKRGTPSEPPESRS